MSVQVDQLCVFGFLSEERFCYQRCHRYAFPGEIDIGGSVVLCFCHFPEVSCFAFVASVDIPQGVGKEVTSERCSAVLDPCRAHVYRFVECKIDSIVDYDFLHSSHPPSASQCFVSLLIVALCN